MTKQRMPLVGYADRFSAAPGETIEFKISSTSGEPYDARLVRVVSSDPSPDGPGIIEHEVDAAFAGSYPSRIQSVQRGSYMTLTNTEAFDGLGSFSLVATIWPTTPSLGLQGLITRCDTRDSTGFALAIDTAGAVAMLGDCRVAVERPLVERRWYRVWACYDASSRVLTVAQAPIRPRIDADDAGRASATDVGASETDADLVVAAFGGGAVTGHFNGKIERPAVVNTVLANGDIDEIARGRLPPETLACWDFGREIPTRNAVDVGPSGLDGELVNLPTRGVTSSAWDGSVLAWTEKPEHYAAIHFHDDDLYDCGWQTDFAFQIPAAFRSGVYAARLRTSDGDEEMIPFFVTAPAGKPQARIGVLIPTFTYTAYANISRGNATQSLRETIKDWDAWPWNPDDHQEFGLSTYNRHSDGSGISYSSRRRPIITMRSATVCYPDVPGSALRHFAADAHLWYWLETMGYDFDVITDDELHRAGKDAITEYDVVMTTTHPEYHTRETLDAIERYTLGGGRFMYLGGNGFYWKIAVSDAWPDAVEIRRGEGGVRTWAAEPGEYYNAFDGTYGGLWRRNGRPPQALVGVGFTASGEHRGDWYQRSEASYAPEHAWVFEGIGDDRIGDFGLSGGGAAGFELDRADPRLGTPLNAVVLATSESHGDHFMLAPEDILTNLLTWNGEGFKDLIRSDIVYFETANGGAVFSVGSITFCGSLPVNDCDNSVSRMTRNVLNRFLES